jgi:phage FluMu protein gp41
MEPITFELLDGYVDPATKKVHKSVVMHHITMEEQISLKSNATILRLEKSSRSLSSKNPAGKLLAETESQEYHVELLKLIVDRIGEIERGPIMGAVLQKLSSRDVAMMINYHQSGSSLLIPIEFIVQTLTDSGVPKEVVDLFIEKVKKALGETQTPTEQSAD